MGDGYGLLLTGWSTAHYRESADKEVSALIKLKTPDVPNMEENFTIDELPPSTLHDLPIFNESVEFFGDESDFERGARIVSLEKALELAVNHNRQYQQEKEILYFEALNLSLARHDYTPIFSSDSSVNYRDVQAGVDNRVRERTVSGSSRFGADQLLKAGGRIATSFTTDFLRFIRSDSSLVTSSSLAWRRVQGRHGKPDSGRKESAL